MDTLKNALNKMKVHMIHKLGGILETGIDYGETTLTETAESPLDDDEVDEGQVWQMESGGHFVTNPSTFPVDSHFVVSLEAPAYILGFKNVNCMNRCIRRMKRKKEQERRKKLKETKKQEG